MSTSTILFALLVAVSLVFIFFPLSARRWVRDARADRNRALAVEKARVLELIKDLEFDRRTGKLSEADYEIARQEAEDEAIRIMKEMDATDAGKGWTDEALEEEIRRIRHDLARESA